MDSSKNYITAINGEQLFIDDFENVRGKINNKSYDLQSLMNGLYALSESIIIAEHKEDNGVEWPVINKEINKSAPPAEKGFWLDIGEYEE